jgi:hypothetical protein
MKTLQISWPMAIVVWCGYVGGAEAAVMPVAVTCEHRVDPLAIDVAAPRLSWQGVEMTAALLRA